MAAADLIAHKIDRAVAAVLERHPGDVRAMLLIGSINAEPTATSDLDVSVVFEDDCYEQHGRELRRELSALATSLNDDEPRHELVLWASKADHFATLFPDVSYVRANLPATDERLDAWCGLAKHTLQHYEEATAKRVWGEAELASHWRIPRAEAVELFLLATRTFAEGIAELHGADAGVQAAGNNHVAKAALRAVYALLLAADGEPRNSYAAIHDAGRDRVPEPLLPVLDAAYRAKTASAPLLDEVAIADVIALLRHCEAAVAGAPRWRIGEGIAKPGDEGFGFDPESLDQDRPPESYSRCPAPDDNYVQFGYFLITAPVVIDRLAHVPPDADLADFFFEELAAVTVHALLQGGVGIAYGTHEPELVQRMISDAAVGTVAAQLEAVAAAYIERGDARKLERTAGLLLVAGQAPGVTVSDELEARVQDRTGTEGVMAGIEWVCELGGSAFSMSGVRLLTRFGLQMYQVDEVPRARRILGRAAELARTDPGRAMSPAQERELAELRSQAFQYLAITEHREGELDAALGHYLDALDHSPENFSALDDLAILLTTHHPPPLATEILLERLGQVAEHHAEAQENVFNRVLNRAVDVKQAGEYEDAEAWYRLALLVAPDQPNAHFNLGLLLEQTGRVPEALEEYLAALELDPEYAKPRDRLLYWRELLERDG